MLLSILGKIFNYILNRRITKFCVDYQILSESQNGFLPFRGTIQHVFAFQEIITDMLNKGVTPYVIFLDLSKAFELGRIAAEQDNLSEFFVIGGSSLYEEAMPHATRLYVTQIEAVIEGDVSFPDINWAGWSSIRNERHEPDEDHAYSFTISEFVRQK